MEIGSSQRHHEVSQSDEGRVRIGEQADDDVAVKYRHGCLIAIQYAVFEIPGRTPVEHARRVVLHLRLLEVEVLRLVVGYADLQAAVVVHVRAAGRATCRPALSVCGEFRQENAREGEEQQHRRCRQLVYDLRVKICM